MKKAFKYILCALLSICFIYSDRASGRGMHANDITEINDIAEISEIQEDSIKPRYTVRKTVVETIDDIKDRPVDFKDPDNIKTEITYDEKNNQYIVGTKAGEEYIETPIYMTPEEYAEWSMKKSLEAYYRNKNGELFSKEADKFSFSDMKFDLGPAEKIFGPGGVQIKTQGSAELKFGIKYKNIENPILSARNRKTIGFDFDEKININVNGKVGDKVNLNMNYNTDATFDFDTKKIKLKYEGKEDEIIQLLEAGNVSMPTNSSLIRGATSLFGIRADLQFGKLKLQTVVSQQESESKTVTSKGGAQTTDFEITVDNYDENRHFFLAHYFRDTYDKNMSQLPNIKSGITIENIEIWVTNKKSNYDNPRNIVAFTDLAERDSISNYDLWKATVGATAGPYNNANNLYSYMTTIPDLRNISSVNQFMTDNLNTMVGGLDYEKIENARLLTSSEYTLNKSVGYISLRQALQPDEVLAVAFNYTYKGETFQVGEFAKDIKENNSTLFVKLLKNTANSPGSGTWHLMMKNVYSLNAYQIQSDKFRLDIQYQSDTTGVYLNYIPEIVDNGKVKTLLRVMNLDRLNSKKQAVASGDGFFDFVEGYTVLAQTGRIIFPVVEPFGSHLKKAFNDSNIAEKYVYQELYDSTKTVAKQIAEKNKFKLKGEYRASSGSEIQLGAMNIPAGSVKVTAGGVTLTENSDYTVDYTMGVVTIINQSIIDAGTSISVNLESNTNFSMQRKTMLGMNFMYDFTKDFQIGGTIMHLSEKPMTTKVSMGDEPISNTLWGLNTSWKKQSQWLTNMIDKIPLINVTQPSNISFNAEFAHLIPGHAGGIQDNASYIDDFESTKIGIDIKYPSYWMLSSTPYEDEKLKTRITNPKDYLSYGKDRALLSWYTIDPLFTRKNSSSTPSHIKNDIAQLSDPYVREVYERELFPAKEATYGQSSMLSILNLAYYPMERGPYNLDGEKIERDGSLLEPENRWGGMMRKLDTSDFEASNIEYIEFWLMDPFYHNSPENRQEGGVFYINLGEISEDVLKDGKKSFENGLPINGDLSKVDSTVWGYIPKERSIVYAFDNTEGARQTQDVGLNGLSTKQERSFGSYSDYLRKVNAIVTPDIYEKYENDPAGDNYHYFRGSDYDAEEKSILERYKYINNTEGNSRESNFSNSAKTTPDVEDVNQDFTLNENEKYFEYKIELTPENMNMSHKYISNIHEASAVVRDGSTQYIKWYQFKVPVKSYDRSVGSIKDLKSIRFMRMYLTDFQEPVVLRFATLELVRGEWRTYEQALNNQYQTAPSISGALDISAVNIEENGKKTPVNYVLPPGISRVIDPSQPQLRQQNEQALSIKITDLESNDARAVYKNTNLDMRQYKRLQMFVHGEALIDNDTELKDQQMSVFIRLGSDYRNNYYEYEIPLSLTPPGSYNMYSNEAAFQVWPTANMLDIKFDTFTDLKKKRNTLKGQEGSAVNYSTIYSEYDTDKPANKVSVIGNPSLAEVKTIMIGVRNNAGTKKSAEVWVNELRLTEFDEEGGWAAQGNMNVQLSDLGTINVGGHIETAGFGGLEQSVSERRLDDYYQYNFTTSFELGKFFPEKAKITAPIYFSYSKELTSPKYNPLDQDILLKDALKTYQTKQEKDSIKSIAQEVTTYKNFSLSNIRIGISSKNPMPYDPANFTFSYSYTERFNEGNTTAWEKDQDWRFNMGYTYSPAYKPYEPFKKIKNKSLWLKIIKEININWLPQNIAFNSDITRHYYELQLRDLDNPNGDTEIPLSYSSEFLWNRDFTLRWDLTKALKMSFSSGTQAEIEEPYRPVNKDLYPDDYTVWKDSVKHSLLRFGRPMDYRQVFNASYQLPLNKIPAFDWMTSDVKYNATYNWNRGATESDGSTAGNTISNQRSIDVNGRLNLETLYNKVPFLKETNRQFASNTRNNNRNRQPAKPKKFEQEIQLKIDTTVTISHNVNSKRPKVTALTAEGKRYIVKYKVLDANKIRIDNLDSIKVKLNVVPGPKPEDQPWYKATQYVARFSMLVRNISVTYRTTNALTLPGYIPEVGDAFGQKRNNGALAPGLAFAFGLQGDDFIQQSLDRNWLNTGDSIINPASTNSMADLQIRMTLEPVRDLKIDLNASRMRNKSSSIQYMFAPMKETRGGNFTMTVITIGSSFGGGNANNGYSSKHFDKFLKNLDIIQKRVEAQYKDAPHYVNSDKEPSINKYTADVMIPAFLAAYTGKDAGSTSLDFFPKLLSMMPNWKISYSGLSKLAFFKKHFKSFNLNHSYRSIYSIGSYSTYQNFTSYTGDLGFVENVTNGELVPSSTYDISSVSINEQFSPLIGVDMTFNNNISAKVEYKKTRVLNLSMAASQIVESGSNDLVIGMGYKLTNVKLFSSNNRNNQKNPISNDLNIRADFSLRNQSALCRNIQENYTQATNGNRAIKISCSADYTFSRLLTLRVYYDRQKNIPLVSSSSYPVTSADFGVSMKFSLTR